MRAIAIVPGTLSRPALLDLLGFVRDRRPRRLLLEVGGESAALDHEAGDHAMELRAVVVLGLHVGEEILDRLRRGGRVELDADLAGGRVELDLRVGGLRRMPAARPIAATAIVMMRRNIGDSFASGFGCRRATTRDGTSYFFGLGLAAGFGTTGLGGVSDGGTVNSVAHQLELRLRALVALVERRRRSNSAPASRE